MRQPAAGSAGEVGIVGAEKLVSLGVVFGLNQPAMRADFDFERVVLFRFCQIFKAQISIGRGRKTQIEEGVLQ